MNIKYTKIYLYSRVPMTKKKGEGRLAAFLSNRYDFQPELFAGGCHLELRGRSSLAVAGCRGIVEYSQTSIILRLKSSLLCVRGSFLCCDSYTRGEVLISGKIDEMGFDDGKI